MNQALQVWRSEKLTQAVFKIFKERRNQLNKELIEGALDNRFRIQELDKLLDEDEFDRLFEGEDINV